MEKMKRRIERFYPILSIAAVISFALGLLIDIRLLLVGIYIMMHLFFGPLDWYIVYRLIKSIGKS